MAEQNEPGGEEPTEPDTQPDDEGTETDRPWGDDESFDADKAARLIANLKRDRDKIKADRDEARGKVQQHEDASKSDHEKLSEGKTTAEKEAAEAKQEAARLRVALKKGLTETQAKRLVGENEEALEQDADDLLDSFKSDDDDSGQEPPRRPRERLRPGAAPGAKPAEDVEPGLGRLAHAYSQSNK